MNTSSITGKSSFSKSTRRKERTSFTGTLVNKEELAPLTRILRNLNIQLVFKYEHTVKSSLIKNSPPTVAGGVYAIPCKVCDEVYIGQTGKTLNERVTQHKYSVRSAQESSGIFKHVERENHCINWDESKFIHKSNSLSERLIVESALIRSNRPNTMNLNDGLYKMDGVLYSLLLRNEKIKKAGGLV